MPSLASAGRIVSAKHAACRALSSRAVCRVFCSTCAAGIRRLVTPSTGSPVAIRRIRPATRTMKNSSRLLAKMARNRTRSSSGTVVVLGQLEHPLVEPEPAAPRGRGYRSGGRSPAVPSTAT